MEEKESPEAYPVDEGKLARPEGTGRSFPIWLYLIPIFLLAAWPALKLLHKANSDSVQLSEEDYSAFNSEEGVIRRPEIPHAANPELDDRVMNVRYRSNSRQAGGEPQIWDHPVAQDNSEAHGAAGQRTQPQAAPGGVRQQTAQAAPAAYGQPLPAMDTLKAREQQSVGYTKGLITGLMKNAVSNPKAVGAVLNNENIVSGFMARDSVKAATGSAEGLAKYLKTGGPANFINNPLVQAAIGNQAVVSAVASSGLVEAMLKTPAAKELMRDPKTLDNLVSSNPHLVSMAMKNPDVVKLVTNNPDVVRLLGKFDTSSIKIKSVR